MIVLDTNVISGIMRFPIEAPLQSWFNDRAFETLYLSSVTLAEIRFGIEALPAGQRRSALMEFLAQMRPRFADRVLNFDEHAAEVYSRLAARAQRAGQKLPVVDGYIAAIAAARGMAVATRDEALFHAAGVSVINPWRPQ